MKRESRRFSGVECQWFAASANILPALILMPLIVVGRRFRGVTGSLFGLAGGFILAGFQEQSSMVLGAVVGGLLLRDWRRGRCCENSWGVFCGALVGIAVMLLSPGNKARAEREAGGHHLPLARSLEHGYNAAQGLWSDSLPHLGLHFPSALDIPDPYFFLPGVVVFWAAIASAVWGQRVQPTAAISWRRLAVVIGTGWFLCTVIFMLTTMTIKRNPMFYQRVYFVPAFVVAGTGMLVGFYARSLAARPPVWLVCLLWMSLLAGLSPLRKINDVSRGMARFAARWDRQDAMLKSLRVAGVQDVRLEPVAPPFGPPMWFDDSSNWVNQEVAKYYGFRSIGTVENR